MLEKRIETVVTIVVVCDKCGDERMLTQRMPNAGAIEIGALAESAGYRKIGGKWYCHNCTAEVEDVL